MSAILDWTLQSVSVAGAHLLDFKENFPERNHYTEKPPVHLLLPLYLKLSINICVHLSRGSVKSDKQRNKQKPPALHHMPAEFLCKAPGSWMEILPWLCGGAAEFWARAGQAWVFKIMFVFCWHKCFNTRVNPTWPVPKIRGKAAFKDLYWVRTDLGQPFSLKTVTQTDLHKKTCLRTTILRHSMVPIHQRRLQLWHSCVLPKQESRQRHFRKI